MDYFFHQSLTLIGQATAIFFAVTIAFQFNTNEKRGASTLQN
jgi:hypothetical protein